MENALREYVNNLFPEAAAHPHLAKARDALMEQTIQQYRQLIAEGKSEQEAYQTVMAGLGYPTTAANAAATPDRERWERYRQQSAWRVAVAVMLYILSILPPILFGIFAPGIAGLGAVFMFVMVAMATGLLVFNHMSKPAPAPVASSAGYPGQPDPLTPEQKSVRRAIMGVFWSLVVAAYLLISFFTGAWHITWLIFLIGGAVEEVIRAILDLVQRP